MNGTITSKNFKATFEFTENNEASMIQITGLSPDARKYLKVPLIEADAFAISKLQALPIRLQNHETRLREFVLARIGG